MKTLYCLPLFFLIFINTSHTQNPLLKKWDYRYGGTDLDRLRYFLQTKSGAFLIGGDSYSGIGGDKSQPNLGLNDYWIVKLDAAGNKLWDKNFGGTNSENLTCFDETIDGGFIIGGISQSGIGGDKTQPLWGNANDEDYWIVKIDSMGSKQWDRDLGGTHYDELLSIEQTTDGGYILGGISASDSTGDKTQPQWGYFDYWIIKLDSNGNKQWDKDIGGLALDQFSDMQQTNDGGYILAGYTYSGIGGDKTEPVWGSMDFWVVKLDSAGNKQWDKNYGTAGYDELSSVKLTNDGGYIIGGYTASGIGGDKTQISWGSSDYWMIKIDSNGNKQWDKDFGGTSADMLDNVIQTRDNGYLLSGISQSPMSGDKTENNLGSEQMWIVKTDSNGNKLWDKTIFTLAVFNQ